MKTEFKFLVCFLVIFMAIAIGCSFEIVSLNEELEVTQNELIATQDELDTAFKNYQIEIDKNIKLNESFDDVILKLEIANMTIDDLKSEKYKIVYLGEYKFTHYCTEKQAHICGTGTGLTATGTEVTAGRTVAVDPSVIPYGTELYIEGYGWRVAEDCGGAVNGNHIDIAVETHSRAMSMGTTTGGVWILVKK